MTAVRIAAVLFWINGVGFGLPVFPAISHVRRGQEVPLIFGFPAYGGGPFERRGIETTVWLLVAFLVVNVLFVVAGALLWAGWRSGAILGFALLPVGAIFWWGFALPFGPVIALAASTLVVLRWADLG